MPSSLQANQAVWYKLMLSGCAGDILLSPFSGAPPTTIALFAAQHLLLKHPSVQWESPWDTCGGVTSTLHGLAANGGESSRPMSRPGCVMDTAWPLVPKLGAETLSRVQCCRLDEAQPQSDCHPPFSCRMSTD